MSKFKKIVITVSLIMISVIVLIGALMIANRWIVIYKVWNVGMWEFNADFEDYESDFCAVKDYLSQHYSSEDKRNFGVSRTQGDSVTLFDNQGKDYIEIPDTINDSLKNIWNYGFPNKDSTLDVIRVYETRVSFFIENGHYALVYSPNEKPTWLYSPDETTSVQVKEIKDGWYHVTNFSNWDPSIVFQSFFQAELQSISFLLKTH